MSEALTQLATTKPLLDTPLRVTIPVNVPDRNLTSTRDSTIYINTFSPQAIAESKLYKKNISNSLIIKGIPNYEFVASSKTPVNMDHDAMLKNSLKDFTLLAFSSKRAGKKDVEATAYASLGVINDNHEQYLGAIEHYQMYLKTCEELQDTIGIAAALNCLGVNYMILTNPDQEDSWNFYLKHKDHSNQTLDYLEKAIKAHQRHLDIGPDNGGKYVASINLGICYTWMGDINQAARCYQEALRVAIKMQTLYGQSIAVGNLGLLALGKKDFTTARTCFDQHLQLIQALLDPEAEILAWKLLSDLSSAQKNFHDTLENLEQARKIAEKEGFLNELRRIYCMIGVAKGSFEFSDYIDNLPEVIDEEF